MPVSRGSRVVFMCGPAGAGKTTVARALDAAGCERLSIDAEAFARGLSGVLSTAEAQAMDRVVRRRLRALLAAGADVVLDFSFSTRAVRDEYRDVVAPHVPVTLFVSTPRATALARLATRDGTRPDEVIVDAAAAAQYYDDFEVPTPAEGPLIVVDGTAEVEITKLVERIGALSEPSDRPQ